MHRELVEQKRWISETRFLHALNYCMVLPGPEAQQLVTYIGWLMHRTWGGIVAGALFVLPSLAVLIALSWIYMAFGNVPAIAGALYGVKPAVTAIVLHAAWRIGSRALKSPPLWAIAAAAFVAIYVFAVPFPAIVLAAGLIGALGGRIAPRQFATGGAHAALAAGHARAVIDDNTPSPEHARFRWSRLAAVVAISLLLWAGTLGALVAAFGAQGVLPQMAWFFTKAALVTFGGAYAVLPYVVQGAVGGFGWLTAPQMIDGLALGETTPGPLIMVVQFVGFLGGWNQPGTLSPLAMATLGAAITTWTTFIPCFLWIFLGAPHIEQLRGNARLGSTLTCVTAAVVGVILNLAVWFGLHVFWPRANLTDWFAIVVSVAAFGAMQFFRVGIIPIVVASGVLGLAWSFV